MPTRDQLETALRNADAAGDVQAARQLATALRDGTYDNPPSTLADGLGIKMPSQEQFQGMRQQALERDAGFEQMLTERGAKRRAFMEADSPGFSTPKTDAQLGATQYGKADGAFLGFGDEVIGLFDADEGQRLSGLKDYAQRAYPQDFGAGELHGGVVNAFATAPVAAPRALQAANLAPKVLRPAVAGGTSAAAWDAAYQTGQGQGDIIDRAQGIDLEQTRNTAALGAGVGGVLGAAMRPLSQRQGELELVLEGVVDGGAVSPDGLRTFERFLRDAGVPLNDETVGRLKGVIQDASQSSSGALALPVRLKDVLIKEFEGLQQPIQRQLRGTSGSGDDGAEIIHRAIDEDLPEARTFLRGGLEDTLGSQSRLSAMDDIQGRLTEIGREGYQPLLNKDLSDQQRAVLGEVLNGPGMGRLYEPLRTVAAGEGLDLDGMINAKPLEAAHWMQSKARQLSDRSSDAVTSNAMGALRGRLLKGLNDATAGEYDVVRRQYGDEFGNMQALEFGDRFLTKAARDLDIDLMAREYAELSPSQKEAALLSVRDALQSSTGRGRAKNGPRLTRVSEEQVMTALPKVFGEDGDKVNQLIQETSDFVGSRRAIDSRPGSQTTPLREDVEFAQNTAIRPIRRKIGNAIRDVSTDIGVSTAFGNAVPFRTLRSVGAGLGDFVGGDPNRKMNALAELLEARIMPQSTPQNAFSQSTPPSSAPAVNAFADPQLPPSGEELPIVANGLPNIFGSKRASSGVPALQNTPSIQRPVDADIVSGYSSNLRSVETSAEGIDAALAMIREDRRLTNAKLAELVESYTGYAPKGKNRETLIGIIEQSLDTKWKLANR